MSENRKPQYEAFHVRNNGDNGKGFWTKIGVAWPHKDGKGLDVRLNAMPIDGRVAIRKYEPKPKKDEAPVDIHF